MKWAVRIYTLLLRLYPPDFRDEFGEEMTAVFIQALVDIRQRGRPAWLSWYAREVTSLLTAVMQEQWLRRRGETAEMNQLLPHNQAHDAGNAEAETPLAIIAGIFPFVAFGSMFVLKGINYHTPLAWMEHSIIAYLIVHVLLIVGLGVGWALRFPRWSYAYLGVTVMNSVWLAGVVTRDFRLFGYTFGAERWGWRGWMPLVILTAVMLLRTRSLQSPAPLYRDIRRDWTRLSFGIYAALTWLFMGVAYDGKTWYNQTLYLPLNLFLYMLVITGGAFLYMRGRRPWPRVLALSAAFILHVPISMLVTALAGYSGASTTAVGRLVLPFVWLVYASVPLWPGFANHLWRRFQPV